MRPNLQSAHCVTKAGGLQGTSSSVATAMTHPSGRSSALA